MVKYTLLSDTDKQVFASKYRMYLPSEEELQHELKRERDRLKLEHELAENS